MTRVCSAGALIDLDGAVERRLRGSGVERRAVMEGNARAQVEGPGQSVVADTPVGGEQRLGLAGLGIVVGQGLIDVQHRPDLGRIDHRWIPVDDVERVDQRNRLGRRLDGCQPGSDNHGNGSQGRCHSEHKFFQHICLSLQKNIDFNTTGERGRDVACSCQDVWLRISRQFCRR